MMTSADNGANPSLLIVDDDHVFLNRLGKAFTARSFDVYLASSRAEGIQKIDNNPPDYAVIDMRLEDGNGLDVVNHLSEKRSDSRALILTGFGNIATAVRAIKLGAIDYLAKPADADEIYNALMSEGDEVADPPLNPMSADRVRWEHILRVYEGCDRNISETARRLKMHRRTLQRILSKRAPR